MKPRGKAEGKVEILLRLLKPRFGPLPRTLRRKLEAASIGQLDRYTERVLSATSLKEVFAED